MEFDVPLVWIPKQGWFNWFGGWGRGSLGDRRVEGRIHPMVRNIGAQRGPRHLQGAIFRLQGSVAGPAFPVFCVPSGIALERGK